MFMYHESEKDPGQTPSPCLRSVKGKGGKKRPNPYYFSSF